MTTSMDLATYAAKFTFAGLDAATVAKATDLLINGFSVALAGTVEQQSEIAARHARRMGTGDEATLLSDRSKTTSVQLAAFANGVAAHANDADDTDQRAGGTIHPTAGILGALMSVAEFTHATGEEFVAAYVLAMEFMDRLGLAAPGNEHVEIRHYHPVGPLCHMGATLGSAKLLGLSAEEIEHALGLATTTSSGVKNSVGSMGKSFHAGVASQSGVMNALLARDGFTTVPNWLEHESGWLRVFGGHNSDARRLMHDFGEPWVIMDSPGVKIKDTPGQGALGPALEWLTVKRRELGLRREDIDCVRIGVSDHLIVWGNMWTGTPASVSEAKYNGKFRMALALVHGSAGVRDYTAERITDPDVLEMAERVEYFIHPDLVGHNNPFGYLPFPPVSDSNLFRCEVTLRLRSGETISDWVDHCKGYPQAWYTREELRDRFNTCAEGLLPADEMDDTWNSLSRIHTVNDMATVVRRLCVPGRG